MRITSNDYGPHDPTIVPKLVTVARGGMSRRYGGTRVEWIQVPLPAGLLKQREAINTIAHEQAQERRRARS